jgi:ornithine--oxo-acid transaminase
VFFCNSGTEAVESALKFARYATGKHRIVYADHAFHGLTTGSLSVNGSAEFRKGFDPLLPDSAIPLGDLEALAAELRKGDVAGLIIEPIQGKGVHMPPDGYLTAAATLLHEHGALLICDEVQSGFGRTGKFFAYQHEDVTPDIVTVAKGLSGGYVPVGAMLANAQVFEKVYSSMDRMMVHSTTFKGGTLAMAAGLAALHVLDDENLMDNAARTGAALKGSLEDMAARYDILADVRGRGLMVGLEFDKPSGMRARASWNMLQKARVGLFAQMVVVALFQRHRILTQVSGDHMEVIKLIPPLMISDDDVKGFTEAFGEVIEDAAKGSGLMWEFGRTLVKQAVARG